MGASLVVRDDVEPLSQRAARASASRSVSVGAAGSLADRAAKASAARTAAPSDVTHVGPGAPNPGAHELTGAAGVGARVFEAAAAPFENPVRTIADGVTAPVKGAFDAGRYIGQPIAEAIEPDAVADYHRAGGKDVTGKDAAQGAAIAATFAVAPHAEELIARTLAPAIGSRAAAIAARAAVGGLSGASFDPDDPTVGALLGAGAGAAHAGASGDRATVRRPVQNDAPQVPAPAIPLRQATATALAATPVSTEPEYTVESPAGNSAAPVPAVRDHLPNWDESRMGPKPTPQELELFKQRAVESMLDDRMQRAARGEKIPGFGQSPKGPLPREPIGEPKVGTRVATPVDMGSSVPPDDRVTVGEPVPAEGKRFPATASALHDLARQRGFSIDDAATQLKAANYDVSPEAITTAKAQLAGPRVARKTESLNGMPNPFVKAQLNRAQQMPAVPAPVRSPIQQAPVATLSDALATPRRRP